MRYNYEFKMLRVEMYREGKYPDTSSGISFNRFQKTVCYWVRLFDAKGPEALRHIQTSKIWTVDDKLELVSRVIAGESYTSVDLSAGINTGQLYQWVQRYKINGYEGLAKMKRGRSPKEPTVKKNTTPNH